MEKCTPAFFAVENGTIHMVYAEGPVLAVTLVWYLLSNYLCANAVYLYPQYVPWPIKFVCWVGLIGGGFDHVVEAYLWAAGVPRQHFGQHWLESGQTWIPELCFGITSVIGIFSVLIEFLLLDSTNIFTKAILLGGFLIGAIYEGKYSWEYEMSSLEWHLGHALITHVCLSMVPVFIVWISRKDLSLFMLMPFLRKAGKHQKLK